MSDAKSVLAELKTADVAVQSLCADSRRVRAGDVFVAMKGAQTDGRDYVVQAIKNGAVAVIYEAGKTPVGVGDTPSFAATKARTAVSESCFISSSGVGRSGGAAGS